MKSQREALSLSIFPDEVLLQVCEPVEGFDPGLRDSIDGMIGILILNERNVPKRCLYDERPLEQ